TGRESDRERLGVGARVDNLGLDNQGPEILASKPFDGAKLLRMGISGKIEPELIVVTDGIHYKCVALVLTDRMPVPSRIRIGGVFAAVHEDLPIAVDVPFVKEEYVSWGLHDSPGIGRHARNARWETVGLRIVLRLP